MESSPKMTLSISSIKADPGHRVLGSDYRVLVTCRTALSELCFAITSAAYIKKLPWEFVFSYRDVVSQMPIFSLKNYRRNSSQDSMA